MYVVEVLVRNGSGYISDGYEIIIIACMADRAWPTSVWSSPLQHACGEMFLRVVKSSIFFLLHTMNL